MKRSSLYRRSLPLIILNVNLISFPLSFSISFDGANNEENGLRTELYAPFLLLCLCKPWRR